MSTNIYLDSLGNLISENQKMKSNANIIISQLNQLLKEYDTYIDAIIDKNHFIIECKKSKYISFKEIIHKSNLNNYKISELKVHQDFEEIKKLNEYKHFKKRTFEYQEYLKKIIFGLYHVNFDIDILNYDNDKKLLKKNFLEFITKHIEFGNARISDYTTIKNFVVEFNLNSKISFYDFFAIVCKKRNTIIESSENLLKSYVEKSVKLRYKNIYDNIYEVTYLANANKKPKAPKKYKYSISDLSYQIFNYINSLIAISNSKFILNYRNSCNQKDIRHSPQEYLQILIYYRHSFYIFYKSFSKQKDILKKNHHYYKIKDYKKNIILMVNYFKTEKPSLKGTDAKFLDFCIEQFDKKYKHD